MAVKLNVEGFEQAKKLIAERKVMLDERDDWSEDQPSTSEQSLFLYEHGPQNYARWFLGLALDEPDHSKARYRFPYGDFHEVHRCALLAAQARAAQYKYEDVERAAAELVALLDALEQAA